MNERQYLRKRLYGLSPFLDLMIPNPQDGRTRAIMSKKADLELKDSMLKFALGDRMKEKHGNEHRNEEGEEEQSKMKKLNSCYDLQMFHVILFLKGKGIFILMKIILLFSNYIGVFEQ